jgi:hypothetical protein
MNQTQFESVQHFQKNRVDMQTVKISEIQNPDRDRTLIYGYTCNRDTFHIYLQHGGIHRVVYSPPSVNEEKITRQIFMYETNTWMHAEFAVPNKRVYPAASDFDFCMLLTSKGIHIPFTVMDNRKLADGQVFYGLTKEQLDLLNKGVDKKR